MTEWVTPIRPPEYEHLWCVWDSGGVYEWMVHPDMARNLLRTGIKIDGEWCPVTKIDEWPMIGYWQIRAVKASAVGDGYTLMVQGGLQAVDSA